MKVTYMVSLDVQLAKRLKEMAEEYNLTLPQFASMVLHRWVLSSQAAGRGEICEISV